MNDDKTDQNHLGAGGGVLLGILQGGVLAGSPNPDPISDQKLAFSTPIFRPDILSPYPFSDLAFRQKICHNYLIILECDKKIRTSNAFWIHIFLFLPYSFGIEMNSRSSFENHTQFQTLPLTSDPCANPNNPPTPTQKTSILSLKNNLVIVNIMHSKQGLSEVKWWPGQTFRHSSFLKILFAALLIVCRMNQPFPL